MKNKKKMNNDSWKEQYKKIKILKPYQIKLLDDGPQSHSQTWLVNSMWSEWNDMQKNSDFNQKLYLEEATDPWYD